MNYSNKSFLVVLAFILIALCEPNTLYAQFVPTIPSIDSVAKFEAIPNDLAFDLLGLPGNNVEQPGTVCQFLASIQPVIDSKGSMTPGIAISIAPYQLLMGNRLQLKEYVEKPWVRILSNLQVSLGSAAAQNADSSQDWGIGCRINILNTGDGRLDTNHINKLVQASLEIFNATPIPSDSGTTVTPEFLTLIGDATNKCTKLNNALNPGPGEILNDDEINRIIASLNIIADKLDSLKVGDKTGHEQAIALRRYAKKGEDLYGIKNSVVGVNSSWNTSSLDISAGTVYRSTRAKLSQSSISKYRIWLNGGVGFGSSQLLGQVGFYQQYKMNSLKDSSFATFALMYRFGNQDFRLGIGTYGQNFTGGTINLVAEVRVSNRTWIVASFNREFSKDSAPTWNPGITIKTTGGGLDF